jgi:hypothetical protein
MTLTRRLCFDKISSSESTVPATFLLYKFLDFLCSGDSFFFKRSKRVCFSKYLFQKGTVVIRLNIGLDLFPIIDSMPDFLFHYHTFIQSRNFWGFEAHLCVSTSTWNIMKEHKLKHPLPTPLVFQRVYH